MLITIIFVMNISSLDDVSLGALRTLLVLAEEGNATRAAFRLGVSQSAVSHTLARLRETFGDPLFIRSRGGMMPSARGVEVVTRIRTMLDEFDSVVGEPMFDPAESDVRFTLAVPDHLIACLMPRVVGRMTELAPGIRLLVQSLRVDSPSAVEDDRVDLIISGQMRPAGSLRQRTLLRDRFCVVSSPDHPFAAAPSLEHYLASGHVAFSVPSSQSAIDRALRRLGRSPRRRMAETTSLLSAMLMCRASALLTAVPSVVARELAADLGLVYRDMPFAVEPVLERAYWHPGRQNDRAHAWLRQLLADTVREAGYAGDAA